MKQAEWESLCKEAARRGMKPWALATSRDEGAPPRRAKADTDPPPAKAEPAPEPPPPPDTEPGEGPRASKQRSKKD